jgi:hypothetical protein
MALPDLDVLEEQVKAAESTGDLSELTAQILLHIAAQSENSADYLAEVAKQSGGSAIQLKTLADKTGESAVQLKDLVGKNGESADHLKDLVGKTGESADLLKDAIYATGHLVSGTLGVQLRELTCGLSAINQTFGRTNEILCQSHIDQRNLQELRTELIGLIEKDCQERCRQLSARHDEFGRKLGELEVEIGRRTDHGRYTDEHLQRLQRQDETVAATVQSLRAELVTLVEKGCEEACRQLRAEHAELTRKFAELEATVRQHASGGTHEGAEHAPGSHATPRGGRQR